MKRIFALPKEKREKFFRKLVRKRVAVGLVLDKRFKIKFCGLKKVLYLCTPLANEGKEKLFINSNKRCASRLGAEFKTPDIYRFNDSVSY